MVQTSSSQNIRIGSANDDRTGQEKYEVCAAKVA